MTDRPGARRPATRTPARGASGGASRPSGFVRGDAGRARTDTELKRQKERSEQRRAQANKPFRFYVPVGETRQFIICDDAPDFFLYEHALKDAEGRWGRMFCGCIKEFANCPVCRTAERESYYAMALTIVDLTPFDTRDGDTVEFSRKLLIVKPQQQKKFLRFFQKEGTLRGALFETTRDGEKDATIGNDIEFLEFVPEKEMESYVRTWKDREGKKHTENCAEPYVYEEVFDEPTEESLLAIAGGDPVPGSRAANDRELGARSSRSSGDRPARRGRAADDDWEDAEDTRKFGRGKDADDEPPARPSRRRAAEPEDAAPTRSRTRRAAEPDEQDEPPARRARRAEPDEPDEPPRRGRARAEPEEAEEADESPRRGRASRREPDAEDEAPRRGRSARAASEPDEEDEPPVRRGRTSRAASDEPDESDEPPRRGRASRAEPDDDEPPPRRAAGRTGRSRESSPVDEDDIPF